MVNFCGKVGHRKQSGVRADLRCEDKLQKLVDECSLKNRKKE